MKTTIKTVLITFLVTPETREKLRDISEQDMVSMAETLRRLVDADHAKRQTLTIPAPKEQ